jgi:glycosyltransferase involved in cell wall biosynthesis
MKPVHDRVSRALASRLKWQLIHCLVAVNDIYSKFFEKESAIPNEKTCIVVAVAFNKPRLIRIQLESLKKHLKINFSYLVYDNSTDARASQELKQLSQDNTAIYVKPRAKLAGRINPSLDHAIALDWCAKAIARQEQRPKYVLFLDHDIFLTDDWILQEAVSPNAGITAPRQEREGHTYYWPGLMVINTELTKLELFSFLPDQGLDTGGKLGGQALKQKIATEEMLHSGYICTANGSKINSDDKCFEELLMSNQVVEAYGPWLHLINGSCWRGKRKQDQSLNYILSRINKSLQ